MFITRKQKIWGGEEGGACLERKKKKEAHSRLLFRVLTWKGAKRKTHPRSNGDAADEEQNGID